MKETGIVRHIDGLGRIVIPKEIRRSLLIKEGDPLEICTGEDFIAFKKVNTVARLTGVVHDLRAFAENDLVLTNNVKILEKIKELEELIGGDGK